MGDTREQRSNIIVLINVLSYHIHGVSLLIVLVMSCYVWAWAALGSRARRLGKQNHNKNSITNNDCSKKSSKIGPPTDVRCGTTPGSGYSTSIDKSQAVRSTWSQIVTRTHTQSERGGG